MAKLNKSTGVPKPKETKEDIVRTPDQLEVYHRTQAQDSSWRTGITEEAAINFDGMMSDPMQLPKEAKDMEERKRFKFRWVSKQNLQNALNYPVPRKWWIVNSTQPDSSLTKHCSKMTGAIELNDCVLCFKRWDHYAAERGIVMARAEASDRGGDLGEFAQEKSDDKVVVQSSNKSFTRKQDVVVGAEVGNSEKIEVNQNFEGVSGLVDEAPDVRE